MKHLIDKSIIVRVDSVNITGTLKAEYPGCIVLTNPKKDSPEENNDTVIPRNKISMWVCDSKDNATVSEPVATPEPVAVVPKAVVQKTALCVLACQNKNIKCVGVRMTVNKFKEDITKADYELFMQPCSSRQPSCKCGNLGELQEIEPKLLAALLKDVLIGDYPRKKS